MVIQGTILDLLLITLHRQHDAHTPADVLGLTTKRALGLGLEVPAMCTNKFDSGPTHTSNQMHENTGSGGLHTAGCTIQGSAGFRGGELRFYPGMKRRRDAWGTK